ncbi:hypothetical protein AB0H76_14960 [Nocardia sp. NPDC050712]|uniref:hypothetical protein n=1 Tax=Nocardia sp. NPDC050712 TaxID=3155518 RepID=UPI0033CEFD91
MRRWMIAGACALTLVGATACGSENSGGGGSADSTYKPPAVSNACDLLDLSALNKWESTPGKREPKKQENILGTELNCEAENESTTTGRLAAFFLQTTTHKNIGEARSGYEMGVRFAKNASDVTSSGALPGMGSEAFFVWTRRDFDADGMLNMASAYQVSVLDGALEVHLVLSVAAPVTESEAATVAQQQVRRVLEQLKG